MPYLKVNINRIDDGSLYYHHMKNYEKFRTFIAITAKIEDNCMKFFSGGRKYTFELDKWDVSIDPIL